MLKKEIVMKVVGIGLSVAGMIVTSIHSDSKQTKEINEAVEKHLGKK